jgi:hypothetical protein
MKRIVLHDTYGYDEFITKEEQENLLFWVNSNSHLFETNTTNSHSINAPYGSRQIGILRKIPDSPLELVKKIKDRVIEAEKINDWVLDPKFEDAIGINREGGSIHLHSDSNLEGYTHVRYNVILSYPYEGGHSIYNGKINELKERMVWKCVAGRVKHGSTPVIGEKPRITLTLGFQIKDIIKNVKSFI